MTTFQFAYASERVNLERFNSSTTEDGILNVESGNVSTTDTFKFWLNYQVKPLSVYDRVKDKDNYLGSFVGERVTTHLVSSIPVNDLFSLAGELPVVFYQTPYFSNNVGVNNLNKVGLSDFRLVPKFQVAPNKVNSLAFMPMFTLPTSTSSSFIGQPGLTFSPTLAKSFYVTENLDLNTTLSYKFRHKQNLEQVEFGNELLYSLAARYNFLQDVSLGLNNLTPMLFELFSRRSLLAGTRKVFLLVI